MSHYPGIRVTESAIEAEGSSRKQDAVGWLTSGSQWRPDSASIRHKRIWFMPSAVARLPSGLKATSQMVSGSTNVVNSSRVATFHNVSVWPHVVTRVRLSGDHAN